MSTENSTDAVPMPSPTSWYQVVPEQERAKIITALSILIVLVVLCGCWLSCQSYKFTRFTRTLEQDAGPDATASGCAVTDERATFNQIKQNHVYIIGSDTESEGDCPNPKQHGHSTHRSTEAEEARRGGPESLQTIELHEVNRSSRL